MVVDKFGPCNCEWCREDRERLEWERTVQHLQANRRPVGSGFVIQEMP